MVYVYIYVYTPCSCIYMTRPNIDSMMQRNGTLQFPFAVLSGSAVAYAMACAMECHGICQGMTWHASLMA